MTLDFFIIIICCILALLAHGSRHQHWLEWILRVIIGIAFFGETMTAFGWSMENNASIWGFYVIAGLAFATLLTLFMPVRKGLSFCFSIIDQIVSGQVFVTLIKKGDVVKSFLAQRIFVAESNPHLVALFIYVTAIGFLLGTVDPNSIKLPALPIPIPVPLEQLLSYNGLGLVVLAACGCGIIITRTPVQTMARLAWVKPSWKQVAIGVGLIFFTFGYDWLWSNFTHQMEGGLAQKLSNYNAGTFTAGGGLESSLILSLFVALCAGIGEETLIRGALQPVFGIFPAAALHGLLHGQFSHAPVFIVQVALWSTIMGIVKRYTNTTTTIIGHAGFNFLTTFLFAFNP